MILFAFSDYDQLSRSLQPDIEERGKFRVDRFENGELFMQLATAVRSRDCLILGSIAPPDEHLLSFTLLSHTLKKECAHKSIAILPYLAYSRQDKYKPGRSVATAWVGLFFQASGIDEVVTIDVHSEGARRLFPVPLVSLFPAEIFADALKKHQLVDATLVAPDKGAIWRCRMVNRAAGKPDAEVPYFEKQRLDHIASYSGPFGRIAARVVMIDDMLDTGHSLVLACGKLIDAGARQIYIMVTHGLFTGEEWTKLWSLRVERIFCTDTIPPRKDILDELRITRLSIAKLIQGHLLLLRAENKQAA
ncbi:MAG: ribose-phosphate pyrophosphokinae, ribose-phosphate pyrophosphokinae [Acidobacteriaceae bacterium]|nr:ribose-phosphate pyrophosphokinae, ribose-phosphate pyrophosphokinae [Acidobacteriaceae bacterium]